MVAASPGWQHLDPRVFSATSLRASDGEMHIGGVAVSALIEEFGSPLYVIDEQDARSRATQLRESFTREFARVGATAKIYYASKALLNIEVARWMADSGLGIDVSTGGELAVALAAGVDPASLGMHGNNKSDEEISQAVSSGVGSLILDSAEEVNRVATIADRLGRTQPVFLRVNSGVHASTHEFLATAHEDQKFGVSLEDAESIVARIRQHPSLHLLGLHCHIGSQIFETAGFHESAKRLLGLTARLRESGEVSELNLGGGFGIAYTSADEPIEIGRLAADLADSVRDVAAELQTPLPTISFEPGRAIIGPAGVTLYTVGARKSVSLGRGQTREYVSVDGGMSDNIRTALYNADFTARLANRESDADLMLSRVVGKHCESGDIIVDEEYLPQDVTRGDILVVAATGAYCWSLSNNYNYVARPAMVAVRDGKSRLIVRAETEADLLARNVDWSIS